MKNLYLSLLVTLGSWLNACQPQAPKYISSSNDIYEHISFDMPKIQEPSFPNYTVNITDFGAVGDGKFLNTQAFAKAISNVAEKGGGTVVIPRGLWLTGPITLKSHINLHTKKGAIVIFSSDFNLYPLVETSFEGLDTYRCISPINGRSLENVAITGDGIFDGSGDAWRPVKKSKMTASQWGNLVASGGVLTEKGDIWYPTTSALQGSMISSMNVPDLPNMEAHQTVKDFLRPVMVSLIECKGILVDGPTFQNSPAWCLHPLMCENVIIRNIMVKNPWYSQNGDGLDIESCKNVLLHDCSFDVGDDAICIKSGKNADGRQRDMPTENVLIKNCTVYHGHGGFTIGSEMSGGVKNIQISHCTFIGTDVGLRFKSTRGRGGVVEKVYISNINMLDIPGDALSFNMYYTGKSPIPEEGDLTTSLESRQNEEDIPPITEETPAFRDIHIKKVRCIGAGQATVLQGLPEMNLQRIWMEDIYIEADKGLYCMDARDIYMKNVTFLAKNGSAMIVRNTKTLQVEGFSYDKSSTESPVQIWGTMSRDLTFKDGPAKANIFIGDGINEAAIVVK